MIYFLIISWDYFEFVVGQPMMTSQYQSQVIKYNQFFLQADQPIRVQYSHQIKLFIIIVLLSLSVAYCKWGREDYGV